MLEKPNLPDPKIAACLQHEYGLVAAQVAFLPLGADLNTAVYHITTGSTAYFLKLRQGSFDETSVTLPKFLSDQGIQQIIPPLTTKTGQLWGNWDAYKTILYLFIEGKNGYETTLSPSHWHEFGAALKKIHDTAVPPAIRRNIRHETYSPQAREAVKSFIARVEHGVYDDPVAKEVAAALQENRALLLDMTARTERLAQQLQAQPPPFIVCHSDLHAGNIFIGSDGAFYIVDWDEPILAPKERDLMYVGGGLLASGRSPEEEAALFYETYGVNSMDVHALAYYRYERIIQDIAIYCEQLLLTDAGGADRAQSLTYLQSNFWPNHTIDIAYQTDKTHFVQETRRHY